MKLPGVAKADLSVNLVSQLRNILPSRNPLPPYLLVDDLRDVGHCVRRKVIPHSFRLFNDQDSPHA